MTLGRTAGTGTMRGTGGQHAGADQGNLYKVDPNILNSDSDPEFCTIWIRIHGYDRYQFWEFFKFVLDEVLWISLKKHVFIWKTVRKWHRKKFLVNDSLIGGFFSSSILHLVPLILPVCYFTCVDPYSDPQSSWIRIKLWSGSTTLIKIKNYQSMRYYQQVHN